MNWDPPIVPGLCGDVEIGKAPYGCTMGGGTPGVHKVTVLDDGSVAIHGKINEILVIQGEAYVYADAEFSFYNTDGRIDFRSFVDMRDDMGPMS